MKNSIRSIALLLALVCATFALASCSIDASPFTTNGYVTEEQLLNALERYGNDGDNLNITIDGSGTGDLAAASHALLSSVSIITEFDTRRDSSSGKTLNESGKAGSGIIYKLDKERGDAYIITNYHVVFDEYFVRNNGISDKIAVYLYGQEYSDYEIGASYVGGSKNYDIAVLKIKNSEQLRCSNAIAATFADSELVAPLDRTIAIGNSNGGGISATTGVVSVPSEYIELSMVSGEITRYRVIRTDAAVNSGNSGGGMFNAKGEVIGIIHARDGSSAVNDVGYAIPGNLARAVAENILDNCNGTTKTSVLRCLLGITTVLDNARTEYDLETGKVYIREDAVVHEVIAGGKSDGKIKVGDNLLSVRIGDTVYPTVRSYSVSEAMLNARVGDRVVITALRDGQTVEIVFDITEDFVIAD